MALFVPAPPSVLEQITPLLSYSIQAQKLKQQERQFKAEQDQDRKLATGNFLIGAFGSADKIEDPIKRQHAKKQIVTQFQSVMGTTFSPEVLESLSLGTSTLEQEYKKVQTEAIKAGTEKTKKETEEIPLEGESIRGLRTAQGGYYGSQSALADAKAAQTIAETQSPELYKEAAESEILYRKAAARAKDMGLTSSKLVKELDAREDLQFRADTEKIFGTPMGIGTFTERYGEDFDYSTLSDEQAQGYNALVEKYQLNLPPLEQRQHWFRDPSWEQSRKKKVLTTTDGKTIEAQETKMINGKLYVLVDGKWKLAETE